MVVAAGGADGGDAWVVYTFLRHIFKMLSADFIGFNADFVCFTTEAWVYAPKGCPSACASFVCVHSMGT